MIIESFGIFCIVTFTFCINYKYYNCHKNDTDDIDDDKYNKYDTYNIDSTNIIYGSPYKYNIQDELDILSEHHSIKSNIQDELDILSEHSIKSFISDKSELSDNSVKSELSNQSDKSNESYSSYEII